MTRPPDGIVAPPGLLTRPAASPPAVPESTRITRPQQGSSLRSSSLVPRCRRVSRSHGLHLTPRSLGGCGDPLCVVPACRTHHRAYDRGELDLLPYLEPAWRSQIAHAVGHAGLIGALRRIAGTDRTPGIRQLP
jgi:hypothetical protein